MTRRTVLLVAVAAVAFVVGVAATWIVMRGQTQAPAAAAAPSPSIEFDRFARQACDSAEQGAWLAAQQNAKLSTVTELQDVALRQEELGNRRLIAEWCADHYHG